MEHEETSPKFKTTESLAKMSTSKINILITGASSGIGEALAYHYASEKYHLILTGRDAQRLQKVCDKCIKKSASVSSHVIDVTDEKAMREFLSAQDDITPIDIVVANAGISGGTGGLKDKSGTALINQIRNIYGINIMGVLNTLDPLMDRMVARRSGQIVFISSMAAFAPWPGAPAYSSSKAAIRFLGNSLRGTLAPYNIFVSVVYPGFVKSRITDQNKFPMPFFKNGEYAARKIAKGVEKKSVSIAFPWQMVVLTTLMRLIPTGIMIKINSKMPKKQ